MRRIEGPLWITAEVTWTARTDVLGMPGESARVEIAEAAQVRRAWWEVRTATQDLQTEGF